ncbi:MAG: VWA-like domain-containing protein [Lachnospiraceae bacterium]|nr:VWA-like domain-containing protein [Lachnospiraceae bacterium]
MIDFSEKARQAAPMILQLMQEKAIASDPEHPQAYNLSLWNASAAAPEPAQALWAENENLLFDAEALAACFLEDSEALANRFKELSLDVFFQKNGPSSKRKTVFFGGGSGSDRGEGAGSDSEKVTLSCQSRTDYHKLLRRFCVPREEAIPDLDSFDYIPYLYGQNQYRESFRADDSMNRNGMNMQASIPGRSAVLTDFRLCLMEPLEYSEVNRLDELAIAIDTSGSCSGNLVRRFLEETWNILRQRENFFTRMRIHLIQCDSAICEHRIFTSTEEWEEALKNLKIQGNGNTDFRPVFTLLDTLIAKKELRSLRALLYFTDGDGIYPREAPPYETAFVFVDQESIKGTVPGWAHTIVLDSL